MPSEGQFILVLCICRIGASWWNLAQLPQIMSRDTLKAIQSVKIQISHKMKSYSRLKSICGSSNICFSILRELGQVGQIKPKYPTSSTLIQRESLFKVLNSLFHIKWSLTQRERQSEGWVKPVLVYLGNLGKSDKLSPNTPSHGHQYIESYPKS